ncbi:similar to Kazachstania africana KAFR_0D01260 hypothetical protein [Maudiozyma saulgeensis]|uniref:Uncharacterized protein n=1 Tax=Maudiozyma saulgeensis TaxID=1789683 RepID=A0A1X7R463_9SACH|nr:similar to Kazachstania africana KAFR_0D01260 hypothetical protein [Kazachstania saulgeensis]
MQKSNQYSSEISNDANMMNHPMFQHNQQQHQQQPQQQQQQQQQQQRQMHQGQRTSYDSNVNMVNPVPIAFPDKGPNFEDPVTMHARLKLDYMKSFQDDSHFYPEFPNPNAPAVPNQYSTHPSMNNFNNIQLQNQNQQQQQSHQHMFNSDQQNSFNRSNTPNNVNYLHQKQFNQKLNDRENLLSILAQKSLEKQQHQFQQQQHLKQNKRPNSQHYYQHQQQGDPYLVN